MGNLDVQGVHSFVPVKTMCTITAVQANEILDGILAARRSNRLFRPEVPPAEMISAIIYAGLLAPFAAAAVGGSGKEYFRQFFVLKNGSRSLTAASALVMDSVKKMKASYKKEKKKNPAMQKNADAFTKRLDMILSSGVVPGVGTAPWYIVVAERRGFPPRGEAVPCPCS